MAITVFDSSGKQLGTRGQSQEADASVSNKKFFNKSTESIGGQIARNVFKPVASTISTGLGLPGDIYGGLSSLINYISETTNPYLSVGGQQAGGGLPQVPTALTSQGIREDITKPIGESLFGVGSQEQQPGFIEGLIDKASQYVPYTLGGAALAGGKGAGLLRSLLPGLATNVAQGAVGQGIKSLGGGEGLQLAGEIATGVVAPSIGKLTGSSTDRAILRTANKLKGQEKKAWDLVGVKAKEAGSVSSLNFEKSILDAEKKLKETVLPENRKAVQELLEETYNSMTKEGIGVDTLVNTRKKINDGFRVIKSPGARATLGGLKASIDEELGTYLGKIHTDAVDLTKKIKGSDIFTNALKQAKNNLDPSENKLVTNAVSNLLPFAASVSLFTNPKILIGALGTFLGKSVFGNLKKVMGDPTMKKEAFRALKKIGASNVLPAALGTAKITKKESSGAKSSGITVL